jgi:hypothetical protein
VDAPQAQGFVGIVGEGAKLASSMLTFASDPRNPWAGVLAVSLDNKPLNHSARIVVVHRRQGGEHRPDLHTPPAPP